MENNTEVVESVIASLNVHQYESIEIDETVVYVPRLVLEVIDSLNFQLEQAHENGLSHN
tara:strand:+ start:226 stop:402 length:177 start_codon:yes stop_codon:yes gene_type:complete